jgi:hypothetical protein
VLCNFQRLDSLTKCKVIVSDRVTAAATRWELYGTDEARNCMINYCTIRRRALRRILELAYDFLAMVTGCISVLNFIDDRYTCDSVIIRFAIRHSYYLGFIHYSYAYNARKMYNV